MDRTVDVIARILRQKGTDRVFGVPGGPNIDFVDAASKAGIEVTLCCQESAAALIAAVYGEIKGTTGVCFSDMGPGATNLASGVAYAYLEQTPLIAITARQPVQESDTFASQNFDQKAFFAPITKKGFTIFSANAQSVLEKAFYIASDERPGPVHIDLPRDEAVLNAEYSTRIGDISLRFSDLIPVDTAGLESTIKKIIQAKSPLIIAGMEAKRSNAYEALGTLAEKWKIPVMVTLKGRGVFNEKSDMYGGVFVGDFSKGTFEDAIVSKSDLLICVGVSSVEFLPRKWNLDQPVIHISSQGNIDNFYQAETELVGSVRLILECMAKLSTDQEKWDPKIISSHHRMIENRFSSFTEPLAVHRIVQIARKKLPDNGILTTDVGAFNSVVHYFWRVYEPKTYFTSKGLSTMGIALPSAIAAQLAFPKRKVICFTGDGGLYMFLEELEVCKRLKLPIIIVVFSNNSLGLVTVFQRKKGYKIEATRFDNPDFLALISAYGGKGFRVHTEKAFSEALDAAMGGNSLTLIEAVFNPDTYGEFMNLIRG